MGFFGKLFQKVSTLSGDYNCPMCNKKYSYKYILDDLPGWDNEDNEKRITVENGECDFCKTELEIVYFKNYKGEHEILPFDVKWEEVERQHYEKYDPIEEEIGEVEEELEEDCENEKLKKKLEKLEIKLQKLEDAFESKEDRYSERQERWSEKWEDKLEKEA